MSTIRVPGAASTTAAAINDVGQIAGSLDDARGTHGFVDDHGRFETIDVPGSSGTHVTGINNLGVVGGWVYDDAHGYEGFVDDHGRIATVDVPGGQTMIGGINDFGQVVGM